MADITLTTQASAATPASGEATIYVDSITKKLKTKDDTGTVTDYSNPGNSVTSLTGDVTGTGPGATATSIASTVVTGKVLTGLAAASGTVLSTDTILQAIAKLNSRNLQAWFGNGVDGTQIISVDTTLVRDMYYNDLTITSGATLFTGGYRIHVLGTLTVDSGSFIDRSGANAAGNTTTAALTAATTGSSGSGGAGGGTGAGTAGGASATAVGGAGGAGGTAASAGGTAGTVTVPTAAVGGVEILNSARQAAVAQTIAGVIVTGGSGGGGGGGSGTAGSAGAGGAGGGVIVINARNLVGSGTIKANGGNGATAVLANAGGGGGGGGGCVILLTENDTTLTSLTVTANGGLGGPGNGTGAAGTTGSNGRIYRVRS
jgi:hypothetical protein